MPNNYFRFKKFTVWHGRSSMKVGTDGVLIGAWANITIAKNILDIGTGCGVIALMAAQRNKNAFVDAIDIDADSIKQARENVTYSPWHERINVYKEDISNHYKVVNKKYNHIISNPPFFTDAFKPSAKSRALARHNDKLSFHTLMRSVKHLLADKGKFSLIIPAAEENNILKEAEIQNLYCLRKTYVSPQKEKLPVRIMMEFATEKTKTQISYMAIEKQKRGDYTEEYIELTKDFYLKF